MSAVILDGKKYAQNVFENLKKKVALLDKKPGIAVILVGDNPASSIYVKNKEKKAKETGFNSVLVKLPDNVSGNILEDTIQKLNCDEDIDAILLQLPLPKHLNETCFLDKILPSKDVDGFHPYNRGMLASGQTPYSIPCTPYGIIKLLKSYMIEIEGKNAVVIGRSNIVGKPMADLLIKENATVTVCHSKTKDLKSMLLNADIIVSATGIESIVKADMIKENAVIVDVGIIRNGEGKLKGDVDFENVKNKAGYITPVPGGVGPVTIATLMENTLDMYMKAKNDKQQNNKCK